MLCEIDYSLVVSERINTRRVATDDVSQDMSVLDAPANVKTIGPR